MDAPASTDDWVALSGAALTLDEVARWAALPECGAVVTFTGIVRNHAEGRPGVTALEYEAWEEQVSPSLREVVADARSKWPALGRVAVLHRVGRLGVGEPAVVVVASAAHRGEAFEAARFLIDETKARAPIWKKETWPGGQEWSQFP